jgi:prevent-host-death family protein
VLGPPQQSVDDPLQLVILVAVSTLPLDEVKEHLSELISRVTRQHERITVTVDGHASAVIVAPEDLEALEETIAVLSDSELMRQVADSERDIAEGRVEEADALAAAMRARHASA